MESKYKLRAEEIYNEAKQINLWSIVGIMCQLAEEVEEISYNNFKKIRFQNLFTKEQVEELLLKQRELCAESVMLNKFDNTPWILNAKLKID